MVATLANEEFRQLYDAPDVSTYAELKDGIFVRYRCLSEMLGILLVKEAQKINLNVMIETSGRDIAMYEYVDQFFPDESYRKLAINFAVNDIQFAEQSVDRRMLKEMADGRDAIRSHGEYPAGTIEANAGGPYGSKHLREVEKASRAVWERVVLGENGVAKSWHKAILSIHARDDGEWTCCVGKEEFAISPL